MSAKGCCPIKFAESLASGLPVVMSFGIGDCDDIVTRNKVGIVLKDFSIAEYEKAFDRIQDFFNDRDGVGLRCRAVAEGIFSLSAGIGKYHDVYLGLERRLP